MILQEESRISASEEATYESAGQGRIWLTPEEQAELIVSYQLGRELEKDLQSCKDRALWRELNSSVSRGRESAQRLIEATMGIVWSRLWPEALNRMGEKQAKDKKDDLRSDASAYILSKAVLYDPDINSSFNAYLSNGMDGFISDVLRGHGRTGTIGAAADRVLRMVGAAIKEAAKEGREISRGEIELELERRTQEWALEKLTFEELELDEEGRKEACKRRLSKSGMTSAIKDIDLLIPLAKGDMSFDRKISEEGAVTFGDLIPSPTHVEDAAFKASSETRLDTLYKIALGDQAEDLSDMLVAYMGQLGSVEGAGVVGDDDFDPSRKPKAWTLTRLSERLEMPRIEVRNLLGDRAKARLAAPHAQFAALALEVDMQFETEAQGTLEKVRSWPRDIFAE